MHTFSKKDFLKAKRKFLKFNTDLLKFHISSFDNAHPPKLGMTVSKKYGNAVARNRFKRLMREAFRAKTNRLPSGLMVHVLAKAQTNLSLSQVKIDFDLLIATLPSHGSTSSSFSRT